MAGTLGEVLSTPLIGEPYIGTTHCLYQLVLANKEPVENILKYIKQNLQELCLSIKITQDNPQQSGQRFLSKTSLKL